MARLMTASPRWPSPSLAPSGTVRASLASGIKRTDKGGGRPRRSDGVPLRIGRDLVGRDELALVANAEIAGHGGPQSMRSPPRRSAGRAFFGTKFRWFDHCQAIAPCAIGIFVYPQAIDADLYDLLSSQCCP